MIRSYRVDVRIASTIKGEIVKTSLTQALEEGGWEVTVYADDEPQPESTAAADAPYRR